MVVFIQNKLKRLKGRVVEHKNTIRTENVGYAVAAHYLQAGHGHPDTQKVVVLDVVEKDIRGGDCLKRLLQHETVWVLQLKVTKCPDFYPFL